MVDGIFDNGYISFGFYFLRLCKFREGSALEEANFDIVLINLHAYVDHRIGDLYIYTTGELLSSIDLYLGMLPDEEHEVLLDKGFDVWSFWVFTWELSCVFWQTVEF